MRHYLVLALATALAACASHSPPPSPPEPMVLPPPPPPPVPMPMESFAGPSAPMSPEERERYQALEANPVKRVAEAPVSTFSVDVDTGSYANVRRFLNQGRMPPADAVRVEEMLNYFRYDYPLPTDRSRPFSVTTNVSTTPWNPNSRLLRIGLRGYDLARRERPPANLVFLVDTSGSMNEPDKLPLVKAALSLLADQLQPQDRVSIVAYAGSAGLVLTPTADPSKVKAALSQFEAGGSTAGGQGIELAYATARATRIDGGINRIILATDGDFNVGISDTRQILDMVRRNRDDGITLTTLGFGQGNYNEAMMEQVADAGNGNYAYIDSAMEAQKVLDQELSSTLFTIAKDVKIQVEFNPAVVSEYRLIGYENRLLREEDFSNDAVDAGDIGAGHMVTALYEIVPVGSQGWLGERRYEANRPQGPARPGGELAFVQLRYKLPNEDSSRLIQQPIPASAIAAARAPAGDMAFAAAVAAYGQKLKLDVHTANFGWDGIRRLAGPVQDYWRQEFLKLADLAAAQDAAAAPTQ
ncbi:MAG TPA: VWA domain-containing protein [Allosphingosinicella sp.]|jgi:Ca-activated chloride channel family protein